MVRTAGRRLVPPAVRRLVSRLRRTRAPALPAGTLTMGRHSYHAPTVHYYPGDTAKVRIGSFCSIGDDVEIMPGGNHRVDWVSTFAISLRVAGATEIPEGIPVSKGDVVIGNDVWIGRGARILSGVTIGDGAVVGAYSVVTKPVRPYGIVAGAPASERGRRFSDEIVAALLRIRWWEWSDERIVALADLFESTAIDRFVAEHDPGPAPT